MPAMTTVLYPVNDLARSKALFTELLGVAPTADAPYYVGFDADGIHIGLVPGGGGHGPVPHWQVADIEQAVADLTAAGASEVQGVREVGGGRRVAVLADPDGNPIGLIQD